MGRMDGQGMLNVVLPMCVNLYHALLSLWGNGVPGILGKYEKAWKYGDSCGGNVC